MNRLPLLLVVIAMLGALLSHATRAQAAPVACVDDWLRDPTKLLANLKSGTADPEDSRSCVLTGEKELNFKAIAPTQFAKLLNTRPAGIAFGAGENNERFQTLKVSETALPNNNGVTVELLTPAADIAAVWAATQIKIQKKANQVTLTLQQPQPGPAGAVASTGDAAGAGASASAGAGAGAGAGAFAECTSQDFEPVPDSADDVALKKHCAKRLCITPSGKTYGITAPSDSLGTLEIELWVPHSDQLTYSMKIDYEKILLKNGGLKGTATEKKDAKAKRSFSMAASESIQLTNAGKLQITIGWEGGGTEAVVMAGDPTITPPCSPAASGNIKKTISVSGHYYFMLGFMPTYAGLFDREHTLHRGDDGVQRLFEQDVRDVDYAATLSAYPWGVDEGKDKVAVGALLGTSIRNPGKRWYLGVEVSTPINIGLVAGTGLIVVDALDRDFQVGQPLEDTSFPTHSTVVPTWFLGINVEAELFKKAFKGIAGDD